MTDYAQVQFEPIVQGVLTFPGGAAPGSPLLWTGEGISFVERLAGFPTGSYALFLDEGLPGNAGAVQPGLTPILNPNVATLVTPRGSGAPPISNIGTIGVRWVLNPVAGVGDSVLVITTETIPLALADSPAGLEVIVWVIQNG
jgi:hypothetical protein